MEPETTPAVEIAPVSTQPVSDSGTEISQPKTFGDMMKINDASNEPESSPESQPEQVVESKPEQTGTNNQGYLTRLRSENKSLRQMQRESQLELDRLRSSQTSFASPSVPTEPINSEDEKGLAILDQRLERILDRKMEPLMQQVTQQKEEQVWNDFEQEKFVQELKQPILQEFNNLDPRLPLEQRLQYAKGLAVSKNLDLIIKVNRDVAAEQATENAYQNQDLKRGQRGGGPRPSNATQPADDLLTRVKEGRVSDQEWRERSTEIDALIKQDTLGN